VWQRFLTIFAGPATNYLFAVVLGFALFMTAGAPTGTAWYVVDSVNQGFDAAGKLQPGDRLLAIQLPDAPAPEPLYYRYEGRVIKPIRAYTDEAGPNPVRLFVDRGGERIEVEITPSPDPDAPGYIFGFLPTSEPERARVGVGRSLVMSVEVPINVTKNIVGHLYERFRAKEKPDVGGPVRIAEEMKKAIDIGWIVVIEFLIAINVALGLFNLFPLPALDGGRLMFLIYEMATRRRANPKVEATVTMVGVMGLLILMILVTYQDCARFF
jgi:regulator of sigma E protease